MNSLQELQDCFEKRMANFEADLLKKASNAASLAGLAEDFTIFKTLVLDTLKSFQSQMKAIVREVDNMETRSRRKILLVHGIPEKRNENTSQVLVEVVASKLGLDSFSFEDVSRCHRMGRQSSDDKPRPILVKFRKVAIRDSIWGSKTRLKGTGVTLSEFLTRSRHSAFMAARNEFGISKCWTKEGSVFVLGPDGSRYRVTCVADLEPIRPVVADKPTATKTLATKPRRAAAGTKK